MDFSSQPSSSLISAELAILKAAREQGVEMNRTKLAKLLYLADVQAVEIGGIQFTGATWRWDDSGPYDSALAHAEYELAESGTIEREDDRLSVTFTHDVDDPLPVLQMEIVRDVVRRHGGQSADALRELTCRTLPVIEAQAGGESGVLLNLGRIRRHNQVQSLLARARVNRARRRPQQRDAGVERELLAELAEDSARIRRANELVLGDQ